MEAYRDQYGVPHVRTASPEEAFQAQGRVAALERGLQMEFVRRRALGTWSEVVGARAVRDDTFVRRVGLGAAGPPSYEVLGAPAKAVLAAYTAGVNAVLAERLRDSGLPAAPEPWEPWHCVAVYLGRHVGMGSMAHKLFRTALLPSTPVDVVWRVRSNAGEELVVVPTGTTGRI